MLAKGFKYLCSKHEFCRVMRDRKVIRMHALGYMMVLVGMVACCRDSDTFCNWMRSIDQGETTKVIVLIIQQIIFLTVQFCFCLSCQCLVDR